MVVDYREPGAELAEFTIEPGNRNTRFVSSITFNETLVKM
jgi:hypothetical protein